MCQILLVWFGRQILDTFLVISWDSLHTFKKQFLHWNHESEPLDLNTMNPIIRTIFSKSPNLTFLLIVPYCLYLFNIPIFSCGTQLNIWPCMSVCLSVCPKFCPKFFFTSSRRSLRWMSSTKATHLQQENETNSGWLSWAVPHSEN